MISLELAERAARDLGMTEEDTRERIVAFSRDNRAPPASTITVVVSHLPVWTKLHPDSSDDRNRGPPPGRWPWLLGVLH